MQGWIAVRNRCRLNALLKCYSPCIAQPKGEGGQLMLDKVMFSENRGEKEEACVHLTVHTLTRRAHRPFLGLGHNSSVTEVVSVIV